MKKILILSNMYPSKKYPHYGVFVQNATTILQNGGYKVSVCSTKKCDNCIVRLLAYSWAYAKCLFLGVFGKYDCLYAHFVSHTAIPARILKKIHPSMYLVENAHGNDVVIQTEDDDGTNIKRSRKILPLADRVIVPSSYFKEAVAETFDYPEDKIFVSPSGGVNREILYPVEMQQARQQCGLESDAYYIGLIGRITAGKGWNTAIKAVRLVQEKKIIPNLKLLIVGSGDQDELLTDELEKLNLTNITEKRPFCEQKDLINYYSSLNLFLFVSESSSESLGLVGLEAMACGKVCICSDNPAILTYAIDDYNSLIFKKGNENQLAKKILQVYDMPLEDKQKIILNALETTKKYDQKEVAKNLIHFFDELME